MSFFFKVELNRGNNVLYWRTTAFSVWSKVSKPVLVRNIAITGTETRLCSGVCCWLPGLLASRGGWELVPGALVSRLNLYFLCHSFSAGVAYTSECFPCKPGTYAAKQGSSFCKLCPANSYSNKGETSCHPCDADKYSGDVWGSRIWGSSGVPVHTQKKAGGSSCWPISEDLGFY